MTNPVKKSLFKRILKWTGISFLVIIVALIAIPFLFKDKLIALVKEEANKNLNAKVDFGDFDLTIFSSFPDLRFKINNVQVVGINEFKDDTLANIGQLSTDINLKSLFGDKYQINSVIIDKARLQAKVLYNGKANWDIAKPSTDSTGQPTPESQEPSKFAMKLKELKIKDAYIVYDDQQGNMYSKLEGFNYDLSGDFTQDNFVLSNLLDIAKTTFKMGGVAYMNEVHTRFKADLDADMPNMKFTFKENELDLNDLGLGFDGFVALPDTNVDMDIKFNTKQASFKSILSLIPSVYTKDFASVKTEGSLTLKGFAKGRYNGASMPAFAVDLGIQNAMFKYPSLPKSVNNINVDVHVNNPDGNLDHTVVDVNKFHVEMAGNPIDMSAHVKTPISDPDLRADVKGIIVLSSVKEFIPLDKGDDMNGTVKADISVAGRMSAVEKKQYENFKASGALEIDKMNYKTASLPYEVLLNTMKLNFTNQFVELAAFDALMGKSDVQANGKIENFMQYIFKDDLIKGSFNLNSKLMDLNQLMASSGTSSPAPTATAAPTSTAATGPVEVPGNIDFVLNSKLGKVIYTNMELTNVEGNIVVRERKVDMTNLHMNTLGGALTVNGYYETTNPKKPTTSLNLKVENFDIQQSFKTFNTVQKLAPAAEYAKGLFTATIENFKVGLNEKMEPDLSTVNARGTFKTNAVSVGGFPPFVKLGEALKVEQLKNAEIKNLNLDYFIKDGRINFKPFVTKIANIPTNIEGSTGLDQSIDYKWKMEVPRSMFGSNANSVINGLLGQANAAAGTNVQLGEKINVTAVFGGTVMKPTVKTGMKDDAKSAVATATTQVLNTAINKAQEEAQKILDDAKAQVDKIKAETQALADKTRQEGYAAADKLVEDASNPIAKIAAKKAAEVAKKEVDKKVQKILDETDARSNKIMEDAKAKADAKANEAKK
ncbi:MAG: AsmA family protein [Sediminibacterium sp.]|nr:AsmA family protein [Sediminibacterium sp.]